VIRNAFRDFFRRRRVARHVARHGHVFDYHGVGVELPATAGLAALSALIRGKYEREEAELILRHLPADLPVFELGGSLGVVSRLIRSRLAPGVMHVIVEANADLNETLKANATRGVSDGATRIVNAAIGYDAPFVRFRLGRDVHANAIDDGTGGGSIREVSTVSLATLLSEAGDPASYVLVCDIEGAEFDLFEREQGALAKARLAIVEIHPRAYERVGRDLEEFMELAASAGFIVAETKNQVVSMTRKSTILDP
jgi:FkbM family methyltransferase